MTVPIWFPLLQRKNWGIILVMPQSDTNAIGNSGSPAVPPRSTHKNPGFLLEAKHSPHPLKDPHTTRCTVLHTHTHTHAQSHFLCPRKNSSEPPTPGQILPLWAKNIFCGFLMLSTYKLLGNHTGHSKTDTNRNIYLYWIIRITYWWKDTLSSGKFLRKLLTFQLVSFR